MKKINVDLYGGKGLFGGKETKQRAEEIYCDHCENCRLYNKGLCLRVTDGFSKNYCPYGEKKIIDGYTSRAAKYLGFERQYKNDEVYSKLNYPHKTLVEMIDEYFMFKFPYCYIDENCCCKNNLFGSNLCFIKKENFTNELIYRICTYKPYSMMGDEIKKHREENVPNFLAELKRKYPAIYNRFVKEYPKFDKEINYVGKEALLSTINKNVYVEYNGDYFSEKWFWNGETLKYVSGRQPDFFIAKTKEINCIEFTPKENTYIEITDNNQVNDSTIFKG
jgi:hypothetical protein